MAMAMAMAMAISMAMAILKSKNISSYTDYHNNNSPQITIK